MPTVEVRTQTKIDINMDVAAQWFAGLTDEQQADFFIEVAKISMKWECHGYWAEQYWLVGRHLRDCACSTDEARELVQYLADGLVADQRGQVS